jgi:hypothetical protein
MNIDRMKTNKKIVLCHICGREMITTDLGAQLVNKKRNIELWAHQECIYGESRRSKE